MIPAPPKIFVPAAESEGVQKLREKLGAINAAVRVQVVPAPEAMEGCCYVNVQAEVKRIGGRMRYGWAVWQHGNLFIEAEPHVVFDRGNGNECIDCTPNSFPDGSPCLEILFIASDYPTQDFSTTLIPDNVRVPLIDDERVREALKLCSRKADLINRVPKERHTSGRLIYKYPPDILKQIARLELRISALLSDATQNL